jgi:hypothetical protein
MRFFSKGLTSAPVHSVTNRAEYLISIVDKLFDTIVGWDISIPGKAMITYSNLRDTLAGLVASLDNYLIYYLLCECQVSNQ